MPCHADFCVALSRLAAAAALPDTVQKQLSEYEVLQKKTALQAQVCVGVGVNVYVYVYVCVCVCVCVRQLHEYEVLRICREREGERECERESVCVYVCTNMGIPFPEGCISNVHML